MCIYAAWNPDADRQFESRPGKSWRFRGPTRTEEDFVSHIEGTIACDPQRNGLLLLNRLNTHQSESLVC